MRVANGLSDQAGRSQLHRLLGRGSEPDFVQRLLAPDLGPERTPSFPFIGKGV